MSQAQKDAVLTSLFVALIADGEPSTEELAQFEHSVSSSPTTSPASPSARRS
ncbi:MAG TPA: hypothetical protein VM261_12775 [Kofleriaceae bacterium]|nr:hypothetical protein [Kofleriaceae bacterium]